MTKIEKIESKIKKLQEQKAKLEAKNKEVKSDKKSVKNNKTKKATKEEIKPVVAAKKESKISSVKISL